MKIALLIYENSIVYLSKFYRLFEQNKKKLHTEKNI